MTSKLLTIILYIVFGTMTSLTILFKEINQYEYALFCVFISFGFAILIIAESRGRK